MSSDDSRDSSEIGSFLREVARLPVARPELDLTGRHLDHFLLTGRLGRGGMGVVYLARQKSLGRDVAVKVLRIGEASAGLAIRRFLEEARHLARLRHPHIVAVHEIGRAGVCCDGTGGEPFFTMEYVEGVDLRRLSRRSRMAGRPLSPHMYAAIIVEVLSALEAAHAGGPFRGEPIIHRDISPENILVTRTGAVKVLDFGLAKTITADEGITRAGCIMGTPHYMSPEQVRGEKVDARSDVFSLGAVFYELLTGRRPYDPEGLPPARIEQVIWVQTPLRPSQVIRSATGDGEDERLQLHVLAGKRASTPERLHRQLRRDVDTIVLKAIA